MSRRSAPGSDEFRYRHPIEVRFVDTDALGHVNNAVYLTYFEQARAGYYAALMGSPFGFGEDAQRHTFLVAEATIAYRAPAFFGEPLVCACRVSWASRSSFGLEYRIDAEASPVGAGRRVAEGSTVQVMYDVRADRVTRLAPELRDRFETFEGRPLGRRPA